MGTLPSIGTCVGAGRTARNEPTLILKHKWKDRRFVAERLGVLPDSQNRFRFEPRQCIML
jgi:hypothetical protein